MTTNLNTKGTETVYSPADVCRYLMLSRSTLFRWEKDGLIPSPSRNLHFTGQDERQYSKNDLAAIARRRHVMLKVPLVGGGPLEDRWAERLYRIEFFFDPLRALTKLKALARRHSISDDTLALLAAQAFSLPLQDHTRQKILNLLATNG